MSEITLEQVFNLPTSELFNESGFIVYFICDKTTIYYIGSTQNLKNRMQSHKHFSLIRSGICQLRILITDLTSRNDLFRLENDLILQFSPKLNLQKSGCQKTTEKKNQQNSEGVKSRTMSQLANFLMSPKLNMHPDLPYIHFMTSLLIHESGLTEQEWVKQRLQAKGHLILTECFEERYLPLNLSDFQDLKVYFGNVNKRLRDPITPFDVFISKEQSILEEWVKKKAIMKDLADGYEELITTLERTMSFNYLENDSKRLFLKLL